MASVVTDVLNCAGMLLKEDMSSKILSFKRKVETIKLEIQEALKNRYIDFTSHCVKLDKLTDSFHTAKSEYEILHYHIEKEIKPQLSTSVAECNEMHEDLKRITFLKQTVSDLIYIHQQMEALKNCIAQKSYIPASEIVLAFEKKCSEMSLESQNDVDIICTIKSEFNLLKENLFFHLQDQWFQIINITQAESKKKFVTETELKVCIEPADDVIGIISSLDHLSQLDSMLKSFGEAFLSLICQPIISNDAEIQLNNTSDSAVISVLVQKKEHQHPDVIFSRLTNLFQILNMFPFNLSLQETEHSKTSDSTVMMRLGKLLTEKFCILLIDKCLGPAVPTQSSDFKNFQKTIHIAEQFQNFLIKIGFFSTEENPLMLFIGNIDELAPNKMAVDLLAQARSLMMQDLNHTVIVGSEEPYPIQDNLEELNPTKHGKSIRNASFTFPSCYISASTRDLVELLHRVMQEARNLEAQSLAYSLKLFCTARSICELYCFVVPAFHKDTIISVPRQAAIYHNNCMYIAHNLLALGITKHTLNASLPVTFVDLIPELRRLGTEAFLTQLRMQRQRILELLKDSEVFQSLAEGCISKKVEINVQHCLQQLIHLKRIWSSVLPVETYFMALGMLLNAILEEIISLVTSTVDIAAQVSAQLDSVFGIIIKQSQELFIVEHKDKHEIIYKYVRKWFKFQELRLVLGASLREIVDRWSNGKGPLASHFTSDEVKHLIRALFQNTERRAAALGKIR